jgi:site-specific DNA recombinase
VRLLPLLGLLLVIGSPALAQKCARGSLAAEVTYVRDGDTIEVGGLPIRLQGLAAPEGDEPGGDEATQAMQALVLGRELRCDLDGQRTYDRCVAISAARGQGTCTNNRSVRRGPLEELILDGLRHRLMAPELVEEFVRAFHQELNRKRRDEGAARVGKERELAETRRKLDKLIDALTEGYRAPGLQQRLDELEGRKAALERELIADPPPPIRLHPNIAQTYREKVERLHEVLADPGLREEATEILRGLIERVVIHPAGDSFQVELVGEIVRMVELGLEGKKAALPAEAACSVKVVAGAGFEPATFRL